MAPTLYTLDVSPAARSVLLTAKAIGLELNLKTVCLLSKEQFKPEFLKINPQHTVPTLDDNGYYLWDSHAINIYLVNKYAKTDSLYPKDLEKQATINQRLLFNASIIQPEMEDIFAPIFYGITKTIPQEKYAVISKAYGFLEKFLEGQNFIACDSLTIADFSIISSLSSIEPFFPLKQNEHPQLFAWIQKMEKLPYYVEANKNGSDKLINFIQSKLASM